MTITEVPHAGHASEARTGRESSVSLTEFPAGLDESWKRSMGYGLRRQDRVLFNNLVSKALTKRVVEENNFLISHASDEMRRLHRSLDSGRWLTLCTDVQGQIVHFVGDHASAPRQLQTLMHPGRRLLEAELGTTAPGCALEERRPVVVSRSEHFLLELEEFFCASVPIFDPADSLIGVLDISGVDVGALPLARDLVGFAVRRIENSMVSAVRDCTLLRFHSDERLLGSLFEAMLAVDSHGIIKGSNRTARQLLSMQAGSLKNQSFDSVIEGGLDRIARGMLETGGEPVRLRGNCGCLLFLRTESSRSHVSMCRAQPANAAVAVKAGTFICEDFGLRATYDKALKVLRAGLPVVIHGETGTGKELIARGMHRAVRPQGPFVALNCAAIPESLVEAELFGYADGAFTGARRGGSCGKIEQANLGLLLLDEIGDMSMSLQSRFLRVLQERTVTRVGDSREIPVDLLVVCATHRNLQDLVEKGSFREDLFYRLHGYGLHLPALRERTDVRSIIEGLFQRWSGGDHRFGESAEGGTLITDDAIECLANYSWPGNIRQLEQVIRALIALRSVDSPIDFVDLPADVRAALPVVSQTPAESGNTLEAVQVEAIQRALSVYDGNVSAAARALGISRGTFYKKLKRPSPAPT